MMIQAYLGIGSNEKEVSKESPEQQSQELMNMMGGFSEKPEWLKTME